MNHVILGLLLALACLGLASAAFGELDAPTDDLPAVVRANNSFATDLYGRLKSGNGNLFFSPLSITSALAMAEAGARGNTQAQMRQTLHLANLAPELVPPSMHRLQVLLQPPAKPKEGEGENDSGSGAGAGAGGEAGGGGENDTAKKKPKEKEPDYLLSVANALWGQQGFPLAAGYVDLIESNYGGTLRQVDFAKPAAAAKTINDWVEEKTQDKIKDLVSPASFSSQTRLVLTNAVYFKGSWVTEFKDEQTRDEPFTVPDGHQEQVPMMQQRHQFAYADTGAVQVLALPYKGNDLEMVLLLPHKADGLPEMEALFDAKNLPAWLDQLEPEDVIVSLPRFKTTQAIDLSAALASLGVTDAFNAKAADFSGIATQERLFIGAVVHKAFVEVNEKGTEAAAATAVVMRAAMARRASAEPVVFKADHPFIFLIRHAPSGAILFLGRMADPKQ